MQFSRQILPLVLSGRSGIHRKVRRSCLSVTNPKIRAQQVVHHEEYYGAKNDISYLRQVVPLARGICTCTLKEASSNHFCEVGLTELCFPCLSKGFWILICNPQLFPNEEIVLPPPKDNGVMLPCMNALLHTLLLQRTGFCNSSIRLRKIFNSGLSDSSAVVRPVYHGLYSETSQLKCYQRKLEAQ